MTFFAGLRAHGPCLTFCLLAFVGSPALAISETAKWSGEGSIGGGFSAGNSETADIAAALQLTRETPAWTAEMNANADFAQTDDVETENRLFLAASLNRRISGRTFIFGSASWERDAFSGFASRSFLGGGIGYDLIASDQTDWSVQTGPGIKQDRIRARTDLDPNLTVIGRTVESASIFAQSSLRHTLNDNVQLTNDSTAVSAETSTQMRNELALTASLTQALSARFSFEVRHDTDPPAGSKSTDTLTRFALVYALGS